MQMVNVLIANMDLFITRKKRHVHKIVNNMMNLYVNIATLDISFWKLIMEEQYAILFLVKIKEKKEKEKELLIRTKKMQAILYLETI